MKVWILRYSSHDDARTGIGGVFTDKETAVAFVTQHCPSYRLFDPDDDTFWTNTESYADYAHLEAWTVEGPHAQTNEMKEHDYDLEE